MKIIKIKSCKECPLSYNMRFNLDSWLNCAKTDKVIKETNKIPKWCPLEDYKGGQNEQSRT